MFGAKRLPLNRMKQMNSVALTPNTKLECIGGADRDRTGGLLVANQALSQLSYSPNPVASCQWSVEHWPLITDFWWAWVELNYRPHPYQGCALAT
jgi:hypothetical protein